MIDMVAAVRCLVEASKELEVANREMVSQWEPDEVPPTIRMGEFADRYVALFDLISESERKRILALLENLLVEGDDMVKTAVATGFFEALLAHCDEGHFDFSKIKTMIGPESRAYCRAWNRFTGVEMDVGDDENSKEEL
jgi:hypothetical protein